MTESQTLSEHSLGPFSASRDKDYIHVRRFRSRRRPAEEESAERRPLASTRVWSSTHGASSIESTPALLPARKESLRECDLEEGTDGRKSLVVLRVRHDLTRPSRSSCYSRLKLSSVASPGRVAFTFARHSCFPTRCGRATLHDAAGQFIFYSQRKLQTPTVAFSTPSRLGTFGSDPATKPVHPTHRDPFRPFALFLPRF